MEPLIGRMVQDAPEARPTMDAVVSEFKSVASKLGSLQLRSRLVERRDGVLMNFFKTLHHTSVRTIPHVLTRRPARPTPKTSTSLYSVAHQASVPTSGAPKDSPSSALAPGPTADASVTPTAIKAPSGAPEEGPPS